MDRENSQKIIFSSCEPDSLASDRDLASDEIHFEDARGEDFTTRDAKSSPGFTT